MNIMNHEQHADTGKKLDFFTGPDTQFSPVFLQIYMVFASFSRDPRTGVFNE